MERVKKSKMGKLPKAIRKIFSKLGPGFITGAADDDPSGVATYSIAGAQFGYKLNWLSLFLIPLMFSIQEMCGRIGLTSGMGLAGIIKNFYSRKLCYFAVSLLIFANILNIAADLGIMAASFNLIFGLHPLFWLALITLTIITMEVFISYKKYSAYLKFMSFGLFAYIATAFLSKPDWKAVFYYTFVPHIETNLVFLMTMIGFIGTTISPYLFFWQTSQEVEEEIANGKIPDFGGKPRISNREIINLRRDTIIGMIFSNIIAAFIVITAAATLNKAGITNIATPQEAALALKPLAGNLSYILFGLGMIGIGLQSIPILAGGVSYAISETFGFKEGLGKKLKRALPFYFVLGAATLIGAFINLIHINPITALYYVAIINGLISAPLIAIIIRISDDKRVVGKFRNRMGYRIIGWFTFAFISITSLFMIYNLLKPLFLK